jgi:pimeloyl-ACP methyl ester carboxylesterase
MLPRRCDRWIRSAAKACSKCVSGWWVRLATVPSIGPLAAPSTEKRLVVAGTVIRVSAAGASLQLRFRLSSAAVGIAIFLSSGCTRTQPDTRSAPAAGAPPRLTLKQAHMGDRRLAFYLVSGRAPAILFEAGGGMDSSAWSKVIGPIYRATGSELILYDRAGEGRSDEDRRAYKLQNSLDDLKSGLDQIGAPRRFIFVGHSFGGQIGAGFVTENRDRFISAVLVDANIPSFFTPEAIDTMAATFPKNADMSSKSARTVAAMMKAFPDMQAEFYAMCWPKNLPITTIMSEHSSLPSARQKKHLIEAYKEFVAEASNRTLVLAKGSSHFVMRDRPDVVEAAVIDSVKNAREDHR